MRVQRALVWLPHAICAQAVKTAVAMKRDEPHCCIVIGAKHSKVLFH